VFNTAEDEHVVSVEHIGEETESGANGNGQVDQGNGDPANGE
jgi:DNA gyrase subunit A